MQKSTAATAAKTNNPKTGVVVPLKPNLVIPDRLLVNKFFSCVDKSTQKLTDVHSYLTRLDRLQQPRDLETALSRLLVSFEGGVMRARMPGGRPMLFSSHGASQTAREVLPARFFSGLRQTAALDSEGERLAGQLWRKWASYADRDRMVRTVRMNIDNEIHTVVRACLSPSYSIYSNADFVKTMIDNAGEYASLPVLAWQVSDSAMRVRFSNIEENLFVFRHFDRGELDKTPVPMVEAWNSEVGRRRIGLRAGLYFLADGGCIPHWDDRREWSWVHRGSSDRISDGIANAFTDLKVAADAVKEAYEQSEKVNIDDVFAWLVTHLKASRASDKLVERTREALKLELGEEKGGHLAQAVKAITSASLKETDIFQQYEVERLAARVLRNGLNKAKNNLITAQK
jgi:hypothetical protein